MNNVLRLSLAASLALALASCSEVLQTVDLTVSTEDNSAQEEFNVVEKTLTLAEARAQKSVHLIPAVLSNQVAARWRVRLQRAH
jgi:hypothetical protein